MGHLMFKLLHVAAVVVFLGNITTGVFWVHRAARRRSPAALAEAMAGVIRSDRLFTLPAVAVISLSGAMAAHAGGSGLLRSGWLAWGVGLFLLSGLAFMALVPLQRQLHDQAARPAAHWPDCTRLLRRWNVIGLISLVPAWAALALMVLKLPR